MKQLINFLIFRKFYNKHDVFFIFIFLIYINDVHAMKFTVGANIDASKSTLSSTTDTAASSGSGTGGGILFQGKGFKNSNFETGVIMLQRKLNYINTTDNLDITMNMMQIPFVFKWDFAKVLEAGFGGYYNMGSGAIQEKNTVTNVVSSHNFDEWMFQKTEYGAMVTFGLRIPIKSMELLFDYRSCIGLSDSSTVKPIGWKFNDSVIFIGLRFGK